MRLRYVCRDSIAMSVGRKGLYHLFWAMSKGITRRLNAASLQKSRNMVCITLVLVFSGKVICGLALGFALPLQSAIGEPQETPAYRDGQADRQVWETWFGGLSGVYQTGAEYWAAHRSDPTPPNCKSSDAGFRAGCEAAKTKLAESDRRRRSEMDYKIGWNSGRGIGVTTDTSSPSDLPKDLLRAAPLSSPAALQSDHRAEQPAPIVHSSASDDEDDYVCTLLGSQEPPIAALIHSNHKVLILVQETITYHITCTIFYADGRNAPLFVGDAARYCSALTNNDDVEQKVEIRNDGVYASSYNKKTKTTTSVIFHYRSGILEGGFGTAKCEHYRP
jgi:hypothetical protein